MPNKILPHLDAAEHFGQDCVFWNSHGDDWFLQRDQIKLHHYNGSLFLWDITDAMKPGKSCTEFTLRWNSHDHLPAGLRSLFKRHDYNMRAVFNELLALPWEQRKCWANGAPIDPPGSAGWQEMTGASLPDFPADAHCELHRIERQAIRVWSPFAAVHPLKEKPKKWTVSHVVRVLLAGQFSRLECDGVYTDDYAYDNAVNYHKGDFSDHAVAFARRILENPSGWWAYQRDGVDSNRVSICCHHFDSNSFTFELMKRYNPAAQLAATPLPDGDIAIHAVTIERPTEPAELDKTPRKKKSAIRSPQSVSVITLTINEERDLVELRFPGKPDEDVRAEMKAARFRWYGPAACWYHKHTPENLAWAQAFVARHGGAAVPASRSDFPPEPTKTETTVPQAEPASPLSAPVDDSRDDTAAENTANDMKLAALKPGEGFPKEETNIIPLPNSAIHNPQSAIPSWRQRFAR